MAPAELPIGVVTAFFGAPFFALVLRNAGQAADDRVELRRCRWPWTGGRCSPPGLRVPGGSWLNLVGPNGAGKTTLLGPSPGWCPTRARSGLGEPASPLSRRELAGRSPRPPDADRSRPDDGGGVRALGRRPPPDFGAERRRPSPSWPVLEHLDLAALAARRLDTLCGGERQRAVLARALAQQAPVLLLDEPTTALDVGHQQQVLELVDPSATSLDLTVVSAMHDLTLAGQYADRLLLLDDGQVAVSGGPAEVLTEQNLGRYYHRSGPAGPRRRARWWCRCM